MPDNPTTRPTLMTDEGREAFTADRKAKLTAVMKNVPLRHAHDIVHPVHPDWFDEAQRLREENDRLRGIIRKAASEIAHGYSGDAFQLLCDELEITNA